MNIPDYQSCMLPLLKIAADENEHFFRDAVDKISDQFNLTQEEREALLPSGTQYIISDNVQYLSHN